MGIEMTEEGVVDTKSSAVTECRRMLDMVMYKPGWQMWIQEDGPTQGLCKLMIKGSAFDVNTYQPDFIYGARVFNPAAYVGHPYDFFRFVHHALELQEIHECSEWFRVRGEKLFCPHAEIIAIKEGKHDIEKIAAEVKEKYGPGH